MSVQSATGVPLRLLGQSGCRMAFPGCTVYVDKGYHAMGMAVPE